MRREAGLVWRAELSRAECFPVAGQPSELGSQQCGAGKEHLARMDEGRRLGGGREGRGGRWKVTAEAGGGIKGSLWKLQFPSL